MNYDEAIDYLYNLKIYGMSLGLERIEYLLKTLGSPHRSLKVIHVAGTNGKGSVCAMISSILHAAGYKVGLFTSPHLVSFEERIRLNYAPILKKDVILLVEKAKPIAEEMAESGEFEHPTFFEIVTAMAFEHFKDENVDYAVLEVGLGGRLDATNVVTPLVSVITTLSLDHTHVLGKSLEEVAREKAGIIKNGVPVVLGIEEEEILSMIKQICSEKKCECYISKNMGNYKLKNSSLDGQIFDVEALDNGYRELRIPLLGNHQLKNAQIAALVVDVLKRKGIDIPEKSIVDGFGNTRWPGRFEVVQKNPTIILDCAHNPAGMKALRQTLNEMFADRRITLVMGIMRDKDIPGIVKEIASVADYMILTKPTFERAADPEIIEKEAKKYCNNVVIKYRVIDAVEHAMKNIKNKDVCCITGSIFNVGEAMQVLAKNIT